MTRALRSWLRMSANREGRWELKNRIDAMCSQEMSKNDSKRCFPVVFLECVTLQPYVIMSRYLKVFCHVKLPWLVEGKLKKTK